MSTTPPRLPLRSINENVDYQAEQFHVQTEDAAPLDTTITTHVYRGGVIIATETASYSEFASDDNTDVVRSMMLSQHSELKKKLTVGGFDDRIRAEVAKERGDEIPAPAPPGDVRVPMKSLFTPTPATPLPAVSIPKRAKAVPKPSAKAAQEAAKAGEGAKRAPGEAAKKEEGREQDSQPTVVDTQLSAQLKELFVESQGDKKAQAKAAAAAAAEAERSKEAEPIEVVQAKSSKRPEEMGQHRAKGDRKVLFGEPKGAPKATLNLGDQRDVVETVLAYFIGEAES